MLSIAVVILYNQLIAYLRDCQQVQASTSIIHDIVALIEEKKKALQRSIPVKISSSFLHIIDPDLQQVVRGDEVLFDIRRASHYDVVPHGASGIELMDIWKNHRNMYNKRMRSIGSISSLLIVRLLATIEGEASVGGPALHYLPPMIPIRRIRSYANTSHCLMRRL